MILKEAKRIRHLEIGNHMPVTKKYFRNVMNKFVDLYNERFESCNKNFASDDSRINELSSEVDRLSRIVENHDHSKITFKNNCPMHGYAIKDDGSISDKPITTSMGCFIYLNNKEYFINDLTLNIPKFTKDDRDNVLIIEDTMNCIKNSNDCITKYVEYVVDLDKGTFIRTK